MKAERIFYGMAGVLLLVGAALTQFFTPMKFTGQLCLCAAGTAVVLGLLTRWAPRRSWARWARRLLAVLLAAGFAFFAVLEGWVISWSGTDREKAASAVVVLGAGVNGAAPSLSLLVRLEAALDYVADKPDTPIVVSGGQGSGEDITEARCMADWLVAHGVAEDRVWLEERAANTEENIAFSKELLRERGVDLTDNIAVVTGDYHLCRARRLWGPRMVPVAAHMEGSYWPLTVNYYIREAFAMAELLVFH